MKDTEAPTLYFIRLHYQILFLQHTNGTITTTPAEIRQMGVNFMRNSTMQMLLTNNAERDYSKVYQN